MKTLIFECCLLGGMFLIVCLGAFMNMFAQWKLTRVIKLGKRDAERDKFRDSGRELKLALVEADRAEVNLFITKLKQDDFIYKMVRAAVREGRISFTLGKDNMYYEPNMNLVTAVEKFPGFTGYLKYDSVFAGKKETRINQRVEVYFGG